MKFKYNLINFKRKINAPAMKRDTTQDDAERKRVRKTKYEMCINKSDCVCVRVSVCVCNVKLVDCGSNMHIIVIDSI